MEVIILEDGLFVVLLGVLFGVLIVVDIMFDVL